MSSVTASVSDGRPRSPELGACCVCEGMEMVNNILMLDKLSPIPGHGWGCFECHIEMNGAVAVVCDPCFTKHQGQDAMTWLNFACKGWPATDGRVPASELTGTFGHNMEFHPGWIEYYEHPDAGEVDVTVEDSIQ